MSKYTPKKITKLPENSCFVFGSNKDGNHAGGAAATAVAKFGAVMGQGEGLQGRSYAIPTMEGLDALKSAIERFLAFAAEHGDKTFLVTAIGTGIAGHPAEIIAPMFANRPGNVRIPAEFDLTTAAEIITSYKGFDANLQCRGYQYAIGQTYEHKGSVSACSGGFHACVHPLSVWTYYGVNAGNRFAIVEQSGATSREGDKIASQKITIKAEIGIPGLIKAGVEWTKKAATSPTSGDSANSATSGDSANSATSGYSANSEAKGANAVAANAGDGPAKSGAGGAIFLVERGRNREILAVFASKVSENGIKADTWYLLKGGKPVEVTP